MTDGSNLDRHRFKGARRRRAGRVVAALAVVVALGACGTATPSRSELVDALRTSGVPAAEARCVVRAIFDTLTPAQIEQLYERGNGGVPRNEPSRGDDASDRLSAAMGTCRDRAIGGQPTGDPPTDGPASTGPGAAPASTTTPAAGSSSTGGSAPSDRPSTSGPAFVPSDGSSSSTTVPTGSNGLGVDTPTTRPAPTVTP